MNDYKLDEYCLGMLFEYGVLKSRNDQPGLAWFELSPDGGYLVIYDDDRGHYHTYRNPENWRLSS